MKHGGRRCGAGGAGEARGAQVWHGGGAGVVPIRALNGIPYLPFPACGMGGCRCGMGRGAGVAWEGSRYDTGRGGMGGGVQLLHGVGGFRHEEGAGVARGGGRCGTGRVQM